MPGQQTVHVGSLRAALKLAGLLIGLGVAMALASWNQVQAWRHGQPIGDPRLIFVSVGGLFFIALGLKGIAGLVGGRYRLILSETGIEQWTPSGTRFAHWTSLGRFDINQRTRVLSAEVIGPDADKHTIKAGKFVVSSLTHTIDRLTLLREIDAYHERAFERRGQVLPEPQPAPFDMGPPPARQRSPIGSAAIVFAFDWLALFLGIALALVATLVTKSTGDKTDISCLIGASLILGGFLDTRKWQVGGLGALIGSLLYVASVVAFTALWHPAVRHGVVLLIVLLAVPVFVGLGTWRAQIKRSAVSVY